MYSFMRCFDPKQPMVQQEFELSTSETAVKCYTLAKRLATRPSALVRGTGVVLNKHISSKRWSSSRAGGTGEAIRGENKTSFFKGTIRNVKYIWSAPYFPANYVQVILFQPLPKLPIIYIFFTDINLIYCTFNCALNFSFLTQPVGGLSYFIEALML